MPDILDRIIERRREDYARFGPTFGVELPPSRARAVVPFLSESGTILEIKRASPSKGDIAPWLDPVKLAGQYEEAGTKNISVLTEMRFFKGGLGDLVSASSAFPRVSFLRKDFLLYEEEIEISWRAGADAVLLIARILDQGLLLKMAAKARSLGMTAFIEVREQADIAKLAAAAKAGPVLAGVNSRDLATFHTDPLVPAFLRSSLPCRTVFESGAATPGACRFARRIGFDGILIGEAAAREPANAGSLVKGFLDARPDWVGHFWREIGRRVSSRPRNPETGKARPLVKICGITNAEDASRAAGLGADMLGFVFAKSPRAATPAAVREISALFAAKPGVAGSAADAGRTGESARSGDAGSHAPPARPMFVAVITDPSSSEAKDAFALALEGVIDAIQCHGGDAAVLDAVDAAGGSYGIGRFAAVRLGSEEDLAEVEALVRSGEPRVLVDARVAGASGGTGTRIPSDLVRRAAGLSSLWLSGGLNPSNVRECIEEFSPELIDASSGLESAPGKKDPALLKSFFREIAS